MFKSAGNIGMIKMSRNDMKWISQDRAMQLEDVHVNRRPFELGVFLTEKKVLWVH